MPQNVPAFEWSDDALRLRQLVYERWCEQGRGPTLDEVHVALGLDRRAIRAAYKELELGLICVVDRDTQNCNVVKFQPFSSFPSQVRAYVDGEFHSFVGCAMEATAFSHMPPLADKEIRLDSFDAATLEPISLTVRNGTWLSSSPSEPLVHVSLHPGEWANTDITAMCDSMNFVLSADHAARYEAETGHAGVLFTLEQACWFTSATATARMHDYHWPPGQVNGEAVTKIVRKLGVDTTPWGLAPKA